MPTEIVITQGNYKWRAVLVEPTQAKAWLCEEFINDNRINHYVHNTEHVILISNREINAAIGRYNLVKRMGQTPHYPQY